MKGKLKKRLLSLLLSVALIITGLDVTTVSAAEESNHTEESALEQESEKTQQSEKTSTEQESDSVQSPEETITESEEISTELQTEANSSETVTESQAEEETTTQQTESNSSALETEESSSESQTETGDSESEQESETLTEEQTSETTEETTETITEVETTELATEELKRSDASEMQFEIYVNPLYKDVIDPDELSQQLNSLQVKNLNSIKSTTQSFETFDAAVDYLREQMIARETTVSVQVPSSVSEANKGEEGFHKTLLDAALAHTEECSGQEGDALRWQYGGARMSMSSSSTYTVTYTISYYTTLAQEQELTKKVNEALNSLNLSGKTDYQKVKAIHDYICDTTDYDYDNLNNNEQKIKFTAYGALCTGKAVCQGYAVAFYRMCKEANLPVRIITGIGNGGPHAWNIVKIGSNTTRAAGKYYNIDCTWDGQDKETRHTYFLLNEKDFEDHTRDAEYNTSDFHAQYPMAETSYVDESSLPAGLNKENPNATFTTIDDQTVSSAADGKPKILIFFQPRCTNSQNTIRAIANQGFTGVDIYAAEIYGGSKDTVTDFKNTYGSNAITFLYDTEFVYGMNTQIGLDMFKYAQEGGLTDGNSMSIALPMICYIDANNMLQHITQGIQNASQIEANLKNYCSAAPVKQYKITYELNGGTNHSENPTVFKENSETIILKDPTKSGFTFAGWYLDAAFTQKITQIEQGTASDITLYAKWSTSGATDKLNLDNPTYLLTTLDDEDVTSAANGRPKILIFFSHTCAKSQQTIKSIASSSIPNVDIFALETNKGSKAVVQSFKNTYGSDAITFLYDEYGVQHTRYANDYVNLSGINNFSTVIICYIDANNKFQHITFDTSSASAIKTNLDLYCNGTSEEPAPSETYNITYELNGGTNNSDNPVTYTTETDTITLKAPTKEGYLFGGWYRDAAFTLPITQIVKGSSGNLTLYAKWENETQEPGDDKISISNATIILSEKTFSYNGRNQEPRVTIQYENKPLTLDSDYTLEYKNNRNAGTATITITGINNYKGTVEENFTIQPAQLIITALDKVLLAGSPAPKEYRYEISGLVDGEKLLTLPTFTCNVPDPVKIGKYEIIPSGAKADSNYNADITYRNGTLEVVKEFTGYTVTFDTQKHGTAPEPYNNISAGTTIEKPVTPSAEGYQFEGWYCEPECKTEWNFNTDIVQSDITLYAKWSISLGDKSTFRVQEVADMEYTGKACKPAVSVYDGDTLLKLNKDYSVKYKNNTEVKEKKGNGIGSNYRDDLPSITITGKGNYDGEELCVNFTIQRAKIADTYGNLAKGVTLKYTDQLVTNPSKAVNPFGSLKYGKTLKEGTDFTLSLAKLNETNQTTQTLSNAEIPAGTSGKFLLTITGTGNYDGTIEKTIYVSDKSKLLKNAKITLGANIKNIAFSNANPEKKVVLPVGYRDKEKNAYFKVDQDGNIGSETVNAKDIFTVTCNGDALLYKTDFDVIYMDNDKVGTASMTIIGKGEYVGEKTVSFRITGDAFKANTVIVDGIEDKQYTGTPLTQDISQIKLTYKGKEGNTLLTFRNDYTVSYKKNINKGTATITFTAAKGSIYSGSFNKTFKITAADIADVLVSSENNSVYEIIAAYEKAGAKPTIDLTYNKTPLQNGKDYTISYKNNKAVAAKTAAKSPKMIIKGKGNFTGVSEEIPFTITQGTISKENVTITPVAYNANKPNTYKYTPSVKIKVGNTTLKANTDYKLEFKNNDQASCKAYFENQGSTPIAIITPVDGSNYRMDTEIQIPLPIYQTKLTKNNVYIVVESTIYDGTQRTPDVRVYFADSEHTQALKEVKNEKLTKDEDIKKKGLILLENTNYTLSYGANISAGKNKGSVTINGMSPKYGGSITQKFDILKKTIE